MFRESIHRSLVLPAYDASGRLHEAVFAVREWLLARPGVNELILAGSPGGEADRRCRVEGGRIEETPLSSPCANQPLARAVRASRGAIVIVADPEVALRTGETDRLCRRVDEGWDVALATPEVAAPFADDDPAYDAAGLRRTVCFAAYRGSVARDLADRHATQDFGRSDEHLYLLSDPELKVREEPVSFPGNGREPLSFAGILNLFREAQTTRSGRVAPGWTPAPRAA